jgi:hypothetical protein
MTEQNLMQALDAPTLKEAAISLRTYAMSKDSRSEQQLLDLLNKRPSLMQRLFPTQGNKIAQKVAAEDLQQLVANRQAVVQAHHEAYLAAIKCEANANLAVMEREAKAMGAAHAVQLQKKLAAFVSRNIAEITQQITEDSERILRDLDAKYETAGKLSERTREKQIKVIDQSIDIHMKATESLLNGVITALNSQALLLPKS